MFALHGVYHLIDNLHTKFYGKHVILNIFFFLFDVHSSPVRYVLLTHFKPENTEA